MKFNPKCLCVNCQFQKELPKHIEPEVEMVEEQERHWCSPDCPCHSKPAKSLKEMNEDLRRAITAQDNKPAETAIACWCPYACPVHDVSTLPEEKKIEPLAFYTNFRLSWGQDVNDKINELVEAFNRHINR